MPNFYMKKLQFQEMGSPINGVPQRGKYFYITKDYGEFFPHLSRTVRNDNVLIPILKENNGAKIYTKFVFHNDFYIIPGGTRNEYRIYLNINIDNNGSEFQHNDIVVFEKISQESETVYFLHHFSPTSTYYNYLDQAIIGSETRGQHGFSDNLPFIEPYTQDLSLLKSELPADVEQAIISEQREVNLETDDQNQPSNAFSHLFNESSFRNFVLTAYDFKCAITKTSLNYNSFYNLEAAHIHPRSQNGLFLPSNGIALSRDMHWAFDKGLITITNDFRVSVHDAVTNSALLELNNIRLTQPEDGFFRPHPMFINYHNNNIFGLFLTSGSIRRIN